MWFVSVPTSPQASPGWHLVLRGGIFQLLFSTAADISSSMQGAGPSAKHHRAGHPQRDGGANRSPGEEREREDSGEGARDSAGAGCG